MTRGDITVGEKLKVNDRFCFKMNDKPFRVALISDKIYYVNTGMPNNDKQVGYKVLNPSRSVYFLRSEE